MKQTQIISDNKTPTDPNASHETGTVFFIKEAPIPNCHTWLVIDSRTNTIVETWDNKYDAQSAASNLNDSISDAVTQ